jgi:hypothetical protein
MTKWRLFVLTPAVLASTVVLAMACRDATGPTLEGQPVNMASGGKPGEGGGGPPPQQCARFTGGGRVDQEDGTKNTPDSRDFATFGFQARPINCGPQGSGQIEWVEHYRNGGFTFHGTIDTFGSPAPTEDLDGTNASDCAYFSGTGRLNPRSGPTVDVTFTVTHACDVQEPGRLYDHIRIVIGSDYTRHGKLSGGNIQKHKA